MAKAIQDLSSKNHLDDQVAHDQAGVIIDRLRYSPIASDKANLNLPLSGQASVRLGLDEGGKVMQSLEAKWAPQVILSRPLAFEPGAENRKLVEAQLHLEFKYLKARVVEILARRIRLPKVESDARSFQDRLKTEELKHVLDDERKEEFDRRAKSAIDALSREFSDYPWMRNEKDIEAIVERWGLNSIYSDFDPEGMKRLLRFPARLI
jgi:hypothetical protein